MAPFTRQRLEVASLNCRSELLELLRRRCDRVGNTHQFRLLAEKRLQICLGDAADVPRATEAAEALLADLIRGGHPAFR
jgi:hypothetical protein